MTAPYAEQRNCNSNQETYYIHNADCNSCANSFSEIRKKEERGQQGRNGKTKMAA